MKLRLRIRIGKSMRSQLQTIGRQIIAKNLHLPTPAPTEPAPTDTKGGR